jgi:hypothetical protein
MADTWNLGIEMPEDWIPLPLEPGVDVTGWAEEQARELAQGTSVDAVRLAHHLREWAADSRLRDPVCAFAFLPREIDTVIAILEVDVIHPDDTVPEITLDWIAQTFSSDDFGAPDIVRAKLPAGEAVRIRQNIAGEPAGPSGGRTLIETVTYGIRPPEIESAVVVLASWTAPGIGDKLVEGTDMIVSTLSVETD